MCGDFDSGLMLFVWLMHLLVVIMKGAVVVNDDSL